MRALLGILTGFVGGSLGGAFGVGGAIVTTPAVQVLLGAPPIVAVGTPLPATFPTTISGVQAYRRRGAIDYRAVAWAAPLGAVGAAGGAALTALVDADALLLATALLLGWQSVRMLRERGDASPEEPAAPSRGALMATGLVAGFTSGLLGVGGGIILVPVMTGVLRMPLKTVLGTSLVIISVMIIPGTIVHAALGHIDWAIFAWLTIGAIPGAALGSRWTVRAKDRTVRIAVAALLGAVSAAYGTMETIRLIRGA